ncbi:MAG: PaaI family thioesterase [Deltaproteobacteria bacterium]|nr:PaaI family thioesterase [Deltaproteobacteria bacterium]
MNNEEKTYLPKLEGHGCFACGTANPIGLNLQFYLNGDTVCTDVSLDARYAGWDRVAHGGIISTLLDEAMSWAIMHRKKVFLVTRSMKIKYVRPVLVGMPLIVSGMLVDDSNPPKIQAKAEIRDRDRHLYVRGTAEFVEQSEKDFTLIPEGVRKEMLALFLKFDQ